MEFDLFFSISHTPVGGVLPSEAEMLRNFFAQIEAADQLGLYGTVWVAESHLSTEVQKRNRRLVVPHFRGEVGLNVDFCQLAHHVFRRTRRLDCGAAVMNILCNGGPVAAAERVAACCALHGCEPAERRRLHLGFAAGRFDFINRAYGIDARDAVEEAAWPALKGKIFREAAHIFLRLLRGDALASEDAPATVLARADFRREEDWRRVQDAHRALHGGAAPARIELPRRFQFEELKIVPQEWRRELCVPVLGSHDPALQEEVNRLMPVRIFNLSITQQEVIEDVHARMARAFHPAGGPWRRGYLPRTVMVFLDDTEAAARARAEAALGEYWHALEGTIDPLKVAQAAANALIGPPSRIAEQIRARFHRDDRLMLWFDFYDHDRDRVIRGIERFAAEVAPGLYCRA